MIQSRKPITYPTREASTFADMKITRLSAKLEDGITRATVVLQNFNEMTKDFDPERHTFDIHINDLAAVSQPSIRIANLLTELDAVVQLVYNVQFIQHQIDRAVTDGEDTTQLNIDLNVALGELNADPAPVRV